jgi:hypothetical protein
MKFGSRVSCGLSDGITRFINSEILPDHFMHAFQKHKIVLYYQAHIKI